MKSADQKFLDISITVWSNIDKMANVVSVVLALSLVESRLSLGSKFECELWRKALTDFQTIVKCGSEEGKLIKHGVIRRSYIVVFFVK